MDEAEMEAYAAGYAMGGQDLGIQAYNDLIEMYEEEEIHEDME